MTLACFGVCTAWVAIRSCEVVDEDAPGHDIDHEVVDGDQQVCRSITAPPQGRRDQRATCEVEASLDRKKRLVVVNDRQRLAECLLADEFGPERLALVDPARVRGSQ